MRLLIDNTILVIIDVQQKLVPHMYNYEHLCRRIQVSVNGAKALNIPIICTEQYPKGLGSTVDSIKTLLNGTASVVKQSFSCWDEPAFCTTLAAQKKNTVLLAGIETHVCVMQTAIDMLAHNYQPVVIVDAVSSRNIIDHKTALQRMKQEGCIFATVESFLFELTRTSSIPVFKEISKFVR